MAIPVSEQRAVKVDRPLAPAVDPLERVAGRMSRMGFSREGGAIELLIGPQLGLWDPTTNRPADDRAAVIVAALSRTALPDRAAIGLAAMCAALAALAGKPDELLATLGASATLRARLLNVLGASVALAEHLATHPQDWRVLEGPVELDERERAEDLLTSVGADPEDPVTGSRGTRATVTGAAAVTLLRARYRRHLLAIAGRDLSGELAVEQVTAALAELAAATLRAGLAIAAAEVLAVGTPSFELAVIAMGKTGGGELNYVSDVDVIFVAEPGADIHGTATSVERALRDATALAARLIRVCGEAVWEVDTALRPEGKDGPLVRTLASHVAYYKRWASTWEFQALLKARPVAGSMKLGRAYVAQLAPLVWTASERPGFVADVQAMRRRVVDLLPSAVAAREIKLGSGGLRDVEFAVQLLQMVHGRNDERLRQRGTFAALRALRDGGYVGRDDARSLADAYAFLRTAEHRVQLLRLRRTHLVPEDSEAILRLARSMGFRSDHRGDARAVWLGEWSLHAREVRRLHEKLFYRPLLEAVARVPSDVPRLAPAEAERRLTALGFAEPARALQHIDALTAGLSRRAAIQRALLPALLSEFSAAPDPDAGLLRYRRVSDAAGDTPWYLRTLRDEGKVADRLAYLLGTSKYVADLLVVAPESLRLLGSDETLRLRSSAEIAATMRETATRQSNLAAAVRSVRAVRRTELVRIASADLLGWTTVTDVTAALSATMDATLTVALELAVAATVAAGKWAAAPARMAIIAMGRLGGSELGYGSDADVLFVYEAVHATSSESDAASSESAARFSADVARELRSLLSVPAGDPPVQIDANLRPEGRDGPLARSLESYAAYYRRWSSIWEAQALLRARPCAGDPDLGARFIALVDPVRYPAQGLNHAQVLEIRRLKARIDSERLPRGADPATHTKLGRGGLGDIEWTAQLLQLRYAHRDAGLRTTGTVAAIQAAYGAGRLDIEASQTLSAAWARATRTRNAIMLVGGKAEDQLPAQGRILLGIGRALGYPNDVEPGRLIDDYRRSARHARRVVERIFYGADVTE